MMFRAARQTTALAAILAVLLFGFAGTPRWTEAWVFLILVVGIAMGVSGWLLARDPDLLAARLSSPVSADQTRGVRILVAAVGLGFLAWIAVMGVDHRLHGAEFPVWVEGIGVRAVGEETILRRGLAGYDDYARRVRYRIVPGVW